MRAPATRFLWLGPLILWAAFGALLPAQGAETADESRPLPPQEARKWLSRIHAAAHERNYQGTLVFSADGTLSSARVAHYCEGSQSYERVEVLDGRMQQIYRHNDRVVTLWPHSRVAVIEERDPRQASLRPVIEPPCGPRSTSERAVPPSPSAVTSFSAPVWRPRPLIRSRPSAAPCAPARPRAPCTSSRAGRGPPRSQPGWRSPPARPG